MSASHLDDCFEPLSPLDCAEGPQDAADTQDLQDGHCSSAEIQEINQLIDGDDDYGTLVSTKSID